MAPVGPGASAPAAVVALCGVLASAGGMIAYGVMSAQKLEVLIDQWIPFWFALNLGVLSVEALYLNYKPGAFLGHLNVYINIGYIMWAVLAIIISMISYAVIGWASPAIWAAVGIVPCGLIGYLTKLRGTEGGGEKPSIACMICHFFNFFIKFAHVAVLFFLLFGAAAIAWSENNFAARGKMTGIALSDGVTYNIHVLCEGSGSDNRPTVWIVPPSTHGTPDLYGVQNAMVELGWKVCTFDPPGYAWSDPLRSSLLGPSWNGIFDSILDADEETGASPVVLVAWNTGGGDVAVEFAHRVPERVSALVLLEVNPPGVEWDEYQARENVGDGERKSYKVKTLDERKYVAGLMLGIMAPSGLLQAVTPVDPQDDSYKPEDRWREYRAQTWRPKLYVNHYWLLDYQLNTDKDDHPLSTITNLTMPVTAVLCDITPEQACKVREGEESLSYGECKEAQYAAVYETSAQRELAVRLQSSSNGSPYMFNMTMDYCDLDLPLMFPSETANALHETLQTLNLSN